MFCCGGGGMWFGMMMGGILFLLFWVALIAGAVGLIWWLARGSTGQGGIAAAMPTPAPSSALTTRETPLDTVKMRYAKGEITQDEFERMKRELA